MNELERQKHVANYAERLAATWYRHIIDPGQIVELRALGVTSGKGRPFIKAGYYDGDHVAKMAFDAVEESWNATGVYFTLNPIKPEVLDRRANRGRRNSIERAGTGELTTHADIASRTRLLIDCDPVRPDSKSSATEEECEQARLTALAISDFLREQGWGEARLLALSGNGFHLTYKIDLPTDDGGLVSGVLESLANRFDSARVKVDRAVFDPSRICRLPGTLARKGEDTVERPHRRAKLLEGPTDLKNWQPVPRELLAKLAATALPAPKVFSFPAPVVSPKPAVKPDGGYSGRLRVEDWLRDRGISYRVGSESRGRTKYVLSACPFDPSHKDPDSCVMQSRDGSMSAKCFHNSCTGRGWQAFKDRIGKPGREHYDDLPKASVQLPKVKEDTPSPKCEKPTRGSSQYRDAEDKDRREDRGPHLYTGRNQIHWEPLVCSCVSGKFATYHNPGKGLVAGFGTPCRGWFCPQQLCPSAKRHQWLGTIVQVVERTREVAVFDGTKEQFKAILRKLNKQSKEKRYYASVLIAGTKHRFFLFDPVAADPLLKVITPEDAVPLLATTVQAFKVRKIAGDKRFKPFSTSRGLLPPLEEDRKENSEWELVADAPNHVLHPLPDLPPEASFDDVFEACGSPELIAKAVTSYVDRCCESAAAAGARVQKSSPFAWSATFPSDIPPRRLMRLWEAIGTDRPFAASTLLDLDDD